jgi:hypothetical protein
MEKQDFKISLRVYAIENKGLREYDKHKTDDGRNISWYDIPAVWYKRKDGKTFAAYGYLRDLRQSGLSLAEFISGKDYYTLHATMLGRYNKESAWFDPSINLKRQKEIIKLIEPMLKKIPSCPRGYIGWYFLRCTDK